MALVDTAAQNGDPVSLELLKDLASALACAPSEARAPRCLASVSSPFLFSHLSPTVSALIGAEGSIHDPLSALSHASCRLTGCCVTWHQVALRSIYDEISDLVDGNQHVKTAFNTALLNAGREDLRATRAAREEAAAAAGGAAGGAGPLPARV